ncbi:MAG: hypothetical protein A3F84_27480 [Candidatus Handelsmanbacteria bacterium RIFCSPLOWO2_12_FULL_64_10]|uniref:ABC transporter permease n=1 Tax=Handelsmanbacteria sp. (strain RIFCSPLOWO2_12_FULL_64_10) TaxID=1817868 RepID=A0A1F6D0T0_HANXR|nr:MAG: hypothetical protein A3F84_27480 [Candidatus Handelsmanbacteria bacterium RIFCSPLOWO2_12_FULL_64_10]
MFTRLVQKELLHHLLDFRFLFVFTLCVLLSILGVYVGIRNYARQLQDYHAVSDLNRKIIQVSIDKGEIIDLDVGGYRWNRRPEVLSPLIFGLSGTLGKEVFIHRRFPPLFEFSLFETDPVYALFEVLDLSFIVKVVLSLAVLLFTYDAICGEKEGGTLRLYASFPVSRSTLALAKLTGSTAAVLVPLVLAFLLVSVALSLSSEIELSGEDWIRITLLVGVFALYLAVFAAFSLLMSALTHRRMTAFLGLLGLWTVWLFIVPNVAVDAARRLAPASSVYDLQRQGDALWWKMQEGYQEDWEAYYRLFRNSRRDMDWRSLTEAQRREINEELTGNQNKIQDKWNTRFYAQLRDLNAERRNRTREQQRLATALSALSPLSAVTYASMDLARTGFAQQERMENALYAHLIYLSQYVLQKPGQYFGGAKLADFSFFSYEDNEAVGECLSRNAIHILNLALLAVAGFAGAYVAILRYDVR